MPTNKEINLALDRLAKEVKNQGATYVKINYLPGKKYICPWCGCEAEPLSTHENLALANFQYELNPDRNPLMCSECYGVGGKEDFIYEE